MGQVAAFSGERDPAGRRQKLRTSSEAGREPKALYRKLKMAKPLRTINGTSNAQYSCGFWRGLVG